MGLNWQKLLTGGLPVILSETCRIRTTAVGHRVGPIDLHIRMVHGWTSRFNQLRVVSQRRLQGMGKVSTGKRKAERDSTHGPSTHQHRWRQSGDRALTNTDGDREGTEHSPTQMETERGPSTHQYRWRQSGDRVLTNTDGDREGTEHSPAQIEVGREAHVDRALTCTDGGRVVYMTTVLTTAATSSQPREWCQSAF